MAGGEGGMSAAAVLRSGEGPAIDLMGLGVRSLVPGRAAGGRFSLVEHPMAPRTLGAAMHTHSREDEYSFVLQGRVGLVVGGKELELGPGDFVSKPRDVPHAFWNSTDSPARLLEIISPAGFERFFAELDTLIAGDAGEAAIDALLRHYGVTMDFASGAGLAARHGLRNDF